MRTVDYEAIYSQKAPPPYEPWPIYGAFLRAAVTGHEARCIESCRFIPPPLREGGTHQRLQSGQIDIALFLDVLIVQGDAEIDELNIHGGLHSNPALL